MLSYRHSFHAGNFADVVKHVILMRILDYLAQKDKPWCCIDTHAGAGIYALTGKEAQKNREFDNGIGKLWGRDDLPPVLAEYVSIVGQINAGGRLIHYPGSPYFERKWLRDGDRLVLCELHPADLKHLDSFAAQDRRIKVIHGDGFLECIALLPPPERRGLVLMDPSYEIKSDYRRVVDTLVRACRRFETGIYAIWYPVIDRQRVNRLEQALRATGIKRMQLYELGIHADTWGHGMTASGVIVVNPPWTLYAEMELLLPYLAKVLGQGDQGFYRIYELSGE